MNDNTTIKKKLKPIIPVAGVNDLNPVWDSPTIEIIKASTVRKI